ncbi:hypothetical protein TL18_08475 [Methanobrevibacter sp. YE315]|uniref:zinc ribbon domain-containing protein n=1 Tax=Methanobrevibacter sp. YE315 TaxID=1609968 RepID=UPI000764E4C5|nr:zinc ribbon domain-containing protein [Methanobrevibacter sp. YE315]AMD18050.1 hypothetical protein TL18_08475 [Methanobrevibacter sp. YE315]
MVKCDKCGVEVDDSFELCPNCGNNLKISKEDEESQSQNVVYGKCEKCNSDLPENVIFCPSCGSKVIQPSKPKESDLKVCKNCGHVVEDETTFCTECGANIFTGKIGEYKQGAEANNNFKEKINFNAIILPTIVSLVAAIILSLIGLLIGFSWFSFILATILSVGFFAGTIDNEANACISGLIVGLILGIIENPLVELMFGAFVAGFYEGFFGGHFLILILIGAIIAYVSNVFFKEYIMDIAMKIGIPWI